MVTFVPLVIPLVATGGVCMTLGVAAFRRRGIPGAHSFFSLMLCLTTYALGYACEISSPTLAAAEFWLKVEYVGIAFIPAVLAMFALRIGRHHERWTVPAIAVLMAISSLFVGAAWTNDLHHWLWQFITAAPRTAGGDPLLLEETYGPLIPFFEIYIFAVSAAAAAVLIADLRTARYRRNGQIAAILISLLAPLLGNAILHLVSIPRLDWGALALGISAVALFWAIFQYGLFNMAPLANNLLVYQMADAVIVLDTEDRIVRINPAAETVLQTDSRAAQGKQGTRLLQRWAGLPAWVEAGEEGAMEVGGPPWYEAKLSLLRAHGGTVVGKVVVLRDVTDRKCLEEKLHYMVNHDQLTGLPNRLLFEDRLTQAVGLISRSGIHFGLLYIDIDRFKEINDTRGHLTGDRYLLATAQRLLSCVRKTDTVARVGGDEFVVLLPGCASVEAVDKVACKIVAALGEPIRLEDTAAPCTASVGLVWSGMDGGDPTLLLQRADAAMYYAKTHGGNTRQHWNSELAGEEAVLGGGVR